MIYRIFDTLSFSLGSIAFNFGQEAGPFEGEPDLLLPSVQTSYYQVKSLLEGKRRLHRALEGGDPEQQLMEAVRKSLTRVKAEIIDPLKSQLITAETKEETEQETLSRIMGFARVAHSIYVELQQSMSEVEKGYLLARDQHLSQLLDLYKPSDPVEEWWTVMAVDKVSYSKGAMAIESLASARQVLEHNRTIRKIIETAIRAADVKIEDVLIQSSGDGALVYFKCPNAAVNSAMHVHAAVAIRNKDLPAPRWAEEYRIGIANGKVCTCVTSVPSQANISFEAGGVAIIDAVRIEAKCTFQGIWVCNRTYGKLNETLKRYFNELPEPIDTKPDEERKIHVHKYNMALFLAEQLSGDSRQRS